MGGICQQTATTTYHSIQLVQSPKLSFFNQVKPNQNREQKQQITILLQKYQSILKLKLKNQQQQNKQQLINQLNILKQKLSTQHIQSNKLQTDSNQQKQKNKTFKIMKHKVQDIYYYGNQSNNQPHGLGIQYKPHQYAYIGNFDIIPHGYGYYQNYKQNYIFQGTIQYGLMQGYAKIQSFDKIFYFQGKISKNKGIIQGKININNIQKSLKSYTVQLKNYPQQPAKIYYKDGRMYEGSIDNQKFLPNGQGKMIFPNHSVYQGQWKNGMYDGKGIFKWQNGQLYQGNYKNGKKQGFGILKYTSGKLYRGNWVQGYQNGDGEQLNKQQKIIRKGKWLKGQFLQQKL